MSNKNYFLEHPDKKYSFTLFRSLDVKKTVVHKFLLLLFITHAVFGAMDKSPNPEETVLFDIIYKGDKVGTLKAVKLLEKNRITYSSRTRIKTRILLIKKIDVRYRYKVAYENGKLTSSKVHIKINKKKPKRVLVNYTDEDYVVNFGNGKERRLKDVIDNSSIQLYFKEPQNSARIFSEQLGNFNQIIKIREGLYKMINENGNENLYHYSNGKLKKIEVDGGMVSFEMRAKS